MPAAVAIPAVASVAGAVIQSRGNNKALSYQRRAADQQIQLERERDAAKNARYSAAMDDYKQQRTQYDATRRALLAHYGIDTGGAPATPAGPGPGDARASGGGMSLGQLMGSAQRFAEPAGAPPASAQLGPQGPQGPEGPQPMGAEGDTFDWRNYGVR